MTATAHIGEVQPHPTGGFTWTCLCGCKPDPINKWTSFDGAASALGRHVHKMEQKAQS